MAIEDSIDWLVELHEEQGATLHRLAVMLGADDEAAAGMVRQALLVLHRRESHIVDPLERVELLQEQVVHLARPLNQPIHVPEVEEHEALLSPLRSLVRGQAEILVVSHLLGIFGPELSRVMRMTVRGTNQRLEQALEALAGASPEDLAPAALSEDLSAALRSASRQIRVPKDESLAEELRERSTKPTRGLVRGQLVVVASLVALAVGASAAAMTRGTPDLPEVPPAPATSSPAATPSSAAVAIRAVVKQVPIYYVGRNDGRLYRELRNLPATSSLARSAVEALFTIPPLDPDYTSPWVGQVRDVRVEGDQLVVDLSASSYGALGGTAAMPAINQLVYTVSEVLGNDDLTVRFLSDGAAAPGVFGLPDGYSQQGIAPMPGLWISSPRNQDAVDAGTLTVTGTVKPDLGAPVVAITEVESKRQVAYTVAQTTLTVNSEGWLVWSVSVQLGTPGSYEVVATAGAAPGATVENKIITVQ